jgi:hypothetical protein
VGQGGNLGLFSFGTGCLPLKYVFPFSLVIAKIVGDYFDIRG